MKTFSNIFFDLDGTLTDSSLGIVNCICSALAELGQAAPPKASLKAFIGPPLRQTFSQLLATQDDQLIERAIYLYRKRFSEKGMFENRVYDGIPEVLAELKNAGKNLYVATAKPQQFAIQIVEHFGLADYFNGVYGPDLGGRFEDKGALLSHILSANGLVAEGSVMIGDRKSDILAAKANNVSSIGVTYGFGSYDELVSAGADAICEVPTEILQLRSDFHFGGRLSSVDSLNSDNRQKN
ncbi:MAG: HAD hydrolase-like protein [Cyanobacteria bacterium J06632_3]